MNLKLVQNKLDIKTEVYTDLCLALENLKYDEKAIYRLSLDLEPRKS